MTSEELKVRRKELMERRREELKLKAAGNGDPLALFMVEEELGDVNAHLRALTPGRVRNLGQRKDPGEHQQFVDWARADRSFDEELAEHHQAMLRATQDAVEALTPRQQEVLQLEQAGFGPVEIARRLGLDHSTVSRTLTRAKAAARVRAESLLLLRQAEDRRRLDLSSPEAAKLVLGALTEKQAVYFYLYYVECLSLREVGELTGRDHTTALRSLYRGLRSIGRLFGDRAVLLEHPEALDEVAFALYCGMSDLEDPPEAVRPYVRSVSDSTEKVIQRTRGASLPAEETLTVTVRRGKRRRGEQGPRGKLLEALLARRRERQGSETTRQNPVYRWLVRIFGRLVRQGKEERPHGGVS